MNRKRSQGRFVFFCIAPAAILVTLFIFIPTINVFRMSLYRMGGITNRKEFVGLNNFKTLMGDTNFLQAMQNSIAIIVLVTLCTIFFAIMFGAILHRGKFKGKNFFRIIFYIPNILSIVVIAGIFGAIYNPSTGLLNTFLDAIGLGFLKQQPCGWPQLFRAAQYAEHSSRRAAAEKYMPYYDIINFAKRVRCETIMSVGFLDPVCPPTSVYAAYNACLSERKSMNEVPMGDHGNNYDPSPDRKPGVFGYGGTRAGEIALQAYRNAVKLSEKRQ